MSGEKVNPLLWFRNASNLKRSVIHRCTRCGPYFGPPLKRCSVSRVKPNETFEFAKRDETHSFFGVCGCVGERISFTLLPSYKQIPKNREKSLCPSVLEGHDGSFRHGEMKI